MTSHITFLPQSVPFLFPYPRNVRPSDIQTRHTQQTLRGCRQRVLALQVQDDHVSPQIVEADYQWNKHLRNLERCHQEKTFEQRAQMYVPSSNQSPFHISTIVFNSVPTSGHVLGTCEICCWRELYRERRAYPTTTTKPT